MRKLHQQKLTAQERHLLARTDQAISPPFKWKKPIHYPLFMVLMGMVAFTFGRIYLDNRWWVDLALFVQAVFWTALFLNIRWFNKTTICSWRNRKGEPN